MLFAGGAFFVLIGGVALVRGPQRLAGLIVAAIGLGAVLGVVFRRKLGLTWETRPELGSLLRAVQARERWALAAAAAALLVAYAVVLVESQRIIVAFGLPAGLGDSLGGAAFVDKAEEWVKEYDTPRRRQVAAVANHLAGNSERARELYESLPEGSAGEDLPYATVFWPFAGLCALAVLVYHATRLRHIWKS